jgi:hypothetical protein
MACAGETFPKWDIARVSGEKVDFSRWVRKDRASEAAEKLISIVILRRSLRRPTKNLALPRKRSERDPSLLLRMTV